MTPPRTKAALIAAVERGETFTYLPFYGHAPGDRGRDPRGRHDPTRWRGLNLLGFALCDVRDVLARATA